ncbi:alpha/beta-hydrolase [Neocallimastix californiae]|uniref:Alpha/beta-hydrolase n=1 Tax=Neocallimastix californiae TaxID=1754190 RepID=A0A1Y1Z4E0_9FUNG|nr:alpha/beta-hydrolase [Neocallimastix californiae]|eukprot:ORY04705.1 alpha/beta-hydrolase [Neocallimastix californiae]
MASASVSTPNESRNENDNIEITNIPAINKNIVTGSSISLINRKINSNIHLTYLNLINGSIKFLALLFITSGMLFINIIALCLVVNIAYSCYELETVGTIWCVIFILLFYDVIWRTEKFFVDIFRSIEHCKNTYFWIIMISCSVIIFTLSFILTLFYGLTKVIGWISLLFVVISSLAIIILNFLFHINYYVVFYRTLKKYDESDVKKIFKESYVLIDVVNHLYVKNNEIENENDENKKKEIIARLRTIPYFLKKTTSIWFVDILSEFIYQIIIFVFKIIKLVLYIVILIIIQNGRYKDFNNIDDINNDKSKRYNVNTNLRWVISFLGVEILFEFIYKFIFDWLTKVPTRTSLTIISYWIVRFIVGSVFLVVICIKNIQIDLYILLFMGLYFYDSLKIVPNLPYERRYNIFPSTENINEKEENKNGKEEKENGKEENKNGKEEDKNEKEENKNGKEEDKNGKEENKNGKEEDKNEKEENKNGKEEDKNGKEENKNENEEIEKLIDNYIKKRKLNIRKIILLILIFLLFLGVFIGGINFVDKSKEEEIELQVTNQNSYNAKPLFCYINYDDLYINDFAAIASASYGEDIKNVMTKFNEKRAIKNSICSCSIFVDDLNGDSYNTIHKPYSSNQKFECSYFDNLPLITINDIFDDSFNCIYTSENENIDTIEYIQCTNITSSNGQSISDAYCTKIYDNNTMPLIYDDFEIKDNTITNPYGVQYVDFVFPARNIVVVGVRGTATLEDAFQDVYLWSTSVLLELSGFFGTFSKFWPRDAFSFAVRLIDNKFSIKKNILYFQDVIDHVEFLKSNNTFNKIYLAGHSLGGGTVGIVSARLEIPGIGFSAPGLGYSYRSYDFVPQNLIDNFINVVPLRDPVTIVDSQIGEIINIECDDEKIAGCHSMDNTMSTLNKMCKRKSFG